MASEKPHIAMFPTPGMGHLIPLVEIAKKLVKDYDFSVTLIVPSSGPAPKAQKELLESLPEGIINYIMLPPVNFDDFPNIKPGTRLFLTVTRSLSSFRDAFKSLVISTRPVALVVDLFGTDMIDVAREFKVPPYVAFLPSGTALSLLLYLLKLDEMVSCEYKDMAEPIQIPGSTFLLHGRDFPDLAQDRKADTYKQFLLQLKRYKQAEGILLNSFMALEGATIKALQKRELATPPIFPIGPVIQSGSTRSDSDNQECLKWLDDQPCGSVLFVCFGSGGTLSVYQLNELALGLEFSEQRFLWVVRSPAQSANASYFSAKSNMDPFHFLPEGFVDRTRDRGLVVPCWAPQMEVLSHRSTGGFLTHCGWNSTLESIVVGVPLIAWPLYAEQKMNAVMLTDGLNVALRPKIEENGLVGREEIAKVVKGLMKGEEGKAVRDRMTRLKEAAALAVSEEGSSTKSLNELASQLKKNRNNT